MTARRQSRRKGGSGGAVANRIVVAALPHVAVVGWTWEALAAAAGDLGLGRDAARRAFPAGPLDAVRRLSDHLDRAMEAELKARGIDRMRVRDRIAAAVRARLEIARPHREAVRRTVSFLGLPGRSGLGALLLWRTASAMWYAAGDASVDFSYYTRRALLAGVYGSTLLYWLADDSEDGVDTWTFLDRRIANVMAIPKLKPSALAERFAPSVAKVLLRVLARKGD